MRRIIGCASEGAESGRRRARVVQPRQLIGADCDCGGGNIAFELLDRASTASGSVIQGMSVLARDGASRARLIGAGQAVLRAWPA